MCRIWLQIVAILSSSKPAQFEISDLLRPFEMHLLFR